MKDGNRETIYKANKQKDALVCDGWQDQASSSQYFSFLLTLFLYICQPPFLFLNALMLHFLAYLIQGWKTNACKSVLLNDTGTWRDYGTVYCTKTLRNNNKSFLMVTK